MKTTEDLKRDIAAIYKAGKLPDGNDISFNNITDYLFNNEEYYYNFGVRRKGRYTRNGIKIAVQRLVESKHDFQPHISATFTSREHSQIANHETPKIKLTDDDEFNFHEGETEYIGPYNWPRTEGKVLLLSDIHFPFHNLQAIKAAIAEGRKQQVSGILLNGDIVDFYNASFHDKSHDKKRIVDELHMCREFLQELRRVFPSEKIVYKQGNHETRLARYIQKNAPALEGIDELELSRLLHFKEYNIDGVENQQLINIGDLSVLHGNETRQGGGVNLARTVRMKVGTNILFSNFHFTQEDCFKNIHGMNQYGYAVGCLCDLHPRWQPFNRWNYGYAIIEHYSDGSFYVQNKKIDHVY